jgi:hypothetical protein
MKKNCGHMSEKKKERRRKRSGYRSLREIESPVLKSDSSLKLLILSQATF